MILNIIWAQFILNEMRILALVFQVIASLMAVDLGFHVVSNHVHFVMARCKGLLWVVLSPTNWNELLYTLTH